MALWEKFGGGFQSETNSVNSVINCQRKSNPGKTRIDNASGHSVNSVSSVSIDRNPKSTPPMKAGEGGYLVPDYAAWCPRWWKGCLECPDFMRDRIRFCRKWNLTFCGVEVVAA